MSFALGRGTVVDLGIGYSVPQNPVHESRKSPSSRSHYSGILVTPRFGSKPPELSFSGMSLIMAVLIEVEANAEVRPAI